VRLLAAGAQFGDGAGVRAVSVLGLDEAGQCECVSHPGKS